MAQDGISPDDLTCWGDAAAYALGALDSCEAEDFRRHLNQCIVCRDELGTFTEVTAALGMAAPEQAMPGGARDRILRDIRAGEPALSHSPRWRVRPSRFRRFIARPRVAIAVTAAATLVGIGAVTFAPRGLSPSRVIHARVFGVAGSAELRLAGSRAQLVVSHFPPPARGRIYEVWVEREGRAPSPQAVFNVSASGAARIVLSSRVEGVSTIMVTLERAGGSLMPTRAPVIVASLS